MKNVLLAAVSAGVLAIAVPAVAQNASPNPPSSNQPRTQDHMQSGPTGMEKNSSSSGYSGGNASEGAASSTSSNLNIADLRPVGDNDKGSMDVTYQGISAKQMKDAKIVNPSGDTIGSVDKVLVDKSNQIAAVTTNVGGFIGIGGKEVVIPVKDLKYDAANQKFTSSLTKDEVKGLPEWNANNGNSGVGNSGGSSNGGGMGRPGAGGGSRNR